jgi:hypothetical protein
MQTKYKILNPLTGQYDTFDTFDACANELGARAWEFYLLHTHYNPYTVIEVNDDGAETWRNPTGDELRDPDAVIDDVIEEIKLYKENPEGQILELDVTTLAAPGVLSELPPELLSHLNIDSNIEITQEVLYEAIMSSNLVQSTDTTSSETPE